MGLISRNKLRLLMLTAATGLAMAACSKCGCAMEEIDLQETDFKKIPERIEQNIEQKITKPSPKNLGEMLMDYGEGVNSLKSSLTQSELLLGNATSDLLNFKEELLTAEKFLKSHSTILFQLNKTKELQEKELKLANENHIKAQKAKEENKECEKEVTFAKALEEAQKKAETADNNLKDTIQKIEELGTEKVKHERIKNLQINAEKFLRTYAQLQQTKETQDKELLEANEKLELARTAKDTNEDLNKSATLQNEFEEAEKRVDTAGLKVNETARQIETFKEDKQYVEKFIGLQKNIIDLKNSIKNLSEDLKKAKFEKDTFETRTGPEYFPKELYELGIKYGIGGLLQESKKTACEFLYNWYSKLYYSTDLSYGKYDEFIGLFTPVDFDKVLEKMGLDAGKQIASDYSVSPNNDVAETSYRLVDGIKTRIVLLKDQIGEDTNVLKVSIGEEKSQDTFEGITNIAQELKRLKETKVSSGALKVHQLKVKQLTETLSSFQMEKTKEVYALYQMFYGATIGYYPDPFWQSHPLVYEKFESDTLNTGLFHQSEGKKFEGLMDALKIPKEKLSKWQEQQKLFKEQQQQIARELEEKKKTGTEQNSNN